MYLQREDSKGKRIFFQRNLDEILEFSDNSVVIRNSKYMSGIADSTNMVLFVDNMEKVGPYLSFMGITIVFASPDNKRYNEFMKTKPFPTQLVLNPLEWEDIKVLYNLMATESDEAINWNFSDVEKNFDLLGGIPRFVFAPHVYCVELVERALKDFAPYIYQNMSINGLQLSGKDDTISYRIVNMRSYDNMKDEFFFASDDVSARLMSKFCDYNGKETIKAIVYNSMTPKLKGDFFEIIGHALFMRRVDQYSTSLGPSTEESCLLADYCNSLSGDAKFATSIFKFSSFSLFSSSDCMLAKNCYYKMRTGAETVDAFAIIGNNVYFFQFTTSKTHSVSAFGILSVIELIEKCFSNEKFTLNLVFVGIDGNSNFNSFKSQNVSYSKDLLVENVQKYQGKANISITSSKKANNVQTVVLENKLKLSQYKLGIKFKNLNQSNPNPTQILRFHRV